jgi:hypothetical protein
MGAWFGEEPWGPVCDELPQTETPVGRWCMLCSEPFVEGDQGLVFPVQTIDPRSEGMAAGAHIECMAYHTFGHSLGFCECTRPARRTVREWALALWRSAEATWN